MRVLQKHWLRRLATLPIRIVIIAASLVERVLRPLYRPLVRALVKLKLVARMEQRIAARPRFAILVVFAVPFAIAEPAKVMAVVVLARGHVAIGTTMHVLAYLATF